jgi:hypothetical protein
MQDWRERRQQVVLCDACHHPTSWHLGGGTPAPECDCCSWRKGAAEATPSGTVRTPPAPGYSADKWASMSRPERRAAERAARKRRP